MPIAQSLLQQFAAVEVQAQYSEQVVLVVELEVRHVCDFTQMVINKSGARAVVTPLNGK